MFELPRRENVHENEHCRAGVSKTKSKIRTSAEANEGLQLKSDFVIPKGMTVLGVVIPNGKPANKGFRREDRPDPYSERVEERRCLSDALRDEASETLLRQASAGGDFGPREASAATISRTTAFLDSIRLCGRKADRFPHLAASRAGRQHPPATPPHRIVRRRRRTSTRQLRIAGTVWEGQRHRRT